MRARLIAVLLCGIALAAHAESLMVWNQPPTARAAERQVWDEEAAEFERATGHEVRGIARPYIQQQFVSVMAGGKGPDVAHVWVGALPTLARQGLLAPLDREVEAWDQRGFVPQALWEPAEVDGKLYGVPRDAYVYMLLVRRDLWVAAGLDPAVPPADWEALRSAAKALTRDGVSGFGFTPSAEAFMDFVWQAGGELLQEFEGRVRPAFQLNPGITALTFLRQLRFEDSVMQPNPLATREELAQLFALGRVGMLMGVPDQMPDLISRYGLRAEDLLLFPLPAGPTGIQATHAGGNYYVVNAQASEQRKAAAWEYIRSMLSPLNQLYRWRRMKELAIPIFPGAFATTAQLNSLPEFALVDAALATARREPYLPNWPQIKDHLETSLLQRLFTQRKVDVERRLKEAAEEVEDRYL